MQTTLPALIYLVAALILPLLKEKFRPIFLIIVPFVGWVNILLLQPQSSWMFPFSGFDVVFLRADFMNLFLGQILSVVAIMAAIFNARVNNSKYHVFSLLYVGSGMGIIFSGDLITFYLFWEIMMVAATILVCYTGEKGAVKAAFRYLLMHLFGGGILLAGILLNYVYTGSMDMQNIKEGMPSALMIIGIGLNAAFIPLHTWLPDAYSKAPFTSSLLLSAFTTKIAVYALARMFPGVDEIAVMGVAMAFYGAVFAVIQNDGRKILSYAIISSIGFIVAGIGIGTPEAMNGALLYVWNHVLYNSLLFMCMGVVVYHTGQQRLSKLGGLLRKKPLIAGAAIIGALATAGIPLFNGFISKSMIYGAAYPNPWLYWLLKPASFLTALAVLRFVYFTFFARPALAKVSTNADIPSNGINSREAGDYPPGTSTPAEAAAKAKTPPQMVIAIIIASAMVAIGGIVPGWVTAALPYAAAVPNVFTVRNITEALIFAVIAAGVFMLGRKSFFVPRDRELLDLDRAYAGVAREFIFVSKNPLLVATSWVDFIRAKAITSYSRRFEVGSGKYSAIAASFEASFRAKREAARNRPAKMDLLTIGTSMFLTALIVAMFLIILFLEKL